MAGRRGTAVGEGIAKRCGCKCRNGRGAEESGDDGGGVGLHGCRLQMKIGSYDYDRIWILWGGRVKVLTKRSVTMTKGVNSKDRRSSGSC